jgi:Cu2+-exporting ATPase
MEGLVEGRRMRVGTVRFVSAITGAVPDCFINFLDGHGTVVALGDAGGWLAAFVLGDRIRSETREVIQDLTDRGISVSLLSGDHLSAARHVAQEVGIATVIADASPQRKLEYLQNLQAQGHTVAVIGDGVNDAPMLAGAAVSIAMGSGTHLAHASADAVLLANRLNGLPEAIDVATRTMRVVRQNLAWACAYNFTALPLAMLGYLTPWMAAIGMAGSSLLVVANAVRLARPELRFFARS